MLLSAQVADLYFAYRTTLLRIDIAEQQCRHPEAQPRDHREDIQGGQESELDLQQAKTQYLGHAGDDPGPGGDAGQAAQRACRPARPASRATCRNWRRSRGRCRPSSRWSCREFPAQLLLRRPDIRTAAWQVAAQSAQIGIAKADYFPAITLLGSIGWSREFAGRTARTRAARRRPRADAGNVRLRPDSRQRAPAGRALAAVDRSCSRTARCRRRRRSTMPRSAWSRPPSSS